jgi:hypothetical protein
MQSPDQQAGSVQSTDAKSQGNAGAQHNSSDSGVQGPAAEQAPKPKPTGTKVARRHRKKAASNSNCGNSSSPAGTTQDAHSTAAANSAPSPSNAAGNCPPQRTVVRQGGTSEPSIQLYGSTSGEQANRERSSTDQLLASTEQNLKRIAGGALTQNQQAIVNQIHLFMQQSKAAVAAGDVERAHNLAVKASLLSDELVKP